MNQQIEFLSNGGDTVRDVQCYLSPEAEHLLDWFHIAMRLTTMTQSAKGLPDTMGEEETVPLRDEVVRQLEQTKWLLWHGNVLRALQVLTSMLFDLKMAAFEHDEGKISKLCKAVQEFHGGIRDSGRTRSPCSREVVRFTLLPSADRSRHPWGVLPSHRHVIGTSLPRFPTPVIAPVCPVPSRP
jgi:hypothetical protein